MILAFASLGAFVTSGAFLAVKIFATLGVFTALGTFLGVFVKHVLGITAEHLLLNCHVFKELSVFLGAED